MRIIVFCLFELLCSSFALAANADWKVYGFPSFEGPNICLYDATGIVRTPEQHVKVWTKCLLQQDLDGVGLDSELGQRIIKNVANKVRAVYVPPIALVENIDFDQSLAIIRYEETADLASLPSKAQFFYELNCTERMIRRLSTFIHSQRGDGDDNKPSEWEYTPPEGSGAYLLNILCGKQ